LFLAETGFSRVRLVASPFARWGQGTAGLRSITFFPEGDAERAFDGGRLFEGRTVVVPVGADGSFEGAGLFG
jgi:hypothetical protein